VHSFAGGVRLTLLADTMMPETFAYGGKQVGFVATLGFALAPFVPQSGRVTDRPSAAIPRCLGLVRSVRGVPVSHHFGNYYPDDLGYRYCQQRARNARQQPPTRTATKITSAFSWTAWL
jgi:hypothetical protein